MYQLSNILIWNCAFDQFHDFRIYLKSIINTLRNNSRAIRIMPLLSEEFVQKAILNPLQDEKCSELHPGISCNMKCLVQFVNTCKGLYKMYLLVHIVPFIIFKRNKARKQYLFNHIGPSKS